MVNKESLLVENNLFVDYFNAFLLNPELGGERLRFNFVTGDLELIEPDRSAEGQANETKTSRAIYSSTAESVKHRLESQLKAIIKSTSNVVAQQHESPPPPTTTTTPTGRSATKQSSAKINQLFQQINRSASF